MSYTVTVDPDIKHIALFCWSDKELTSNDKPYGSFDIDNHYTRQIIFIETDNWTWKRTRQPNKNMSEWAVRGRTQLAMGRKIYFYDPIKIESN